jgi:hypothetical protein
MSRKLEQKVRSDYAEGLIWGLSIRTMNQEDRIAAFGSRCYGTDKTAPFTLALIAATDQHEFFCGIEAAKYWALITESGR